MKNNNIIWTKTLLSVYRYLERISGSIDKIILRNALNCRDVGGQNYFFNNTYNVSQRIINLSERKVTLINLKVLIEDTLREINKKDAQLLISKFFNGEKIKDICASYNLSTRTAFRKIDSAVSAFASRLVMKGYNAFKIEEMLKNEGWINNVYLRLSSKNIEEIELSNLFLAKAVSL